MGMGIEVMGKMGMGMQCWNGIGGNGNVNNSMGVGREWAQGSHSRIPLLDNGSFRLLCHVSAGRREDDVTADLLPFSVSYSTHFENLYLPDKIHPVA